MPRQSGQTLDPRIYVDYSRLVRLQAYVGQFSFLPSLKANTRYSGRHNSLWRGRGLNFEELRHYQMGDDIRNLDWKVTLRTGKPHVRSYSEEKDRHIIIALDQRSNMFFSSVEVMKSVIAAEVAALSAWQALNEGDRVSLVWLDDQQLHWPQPTRSKSVLLSWLRQLSEVNQSLNVNSQFNPEQNWNRMLTKMAAQRLRDATILLFSDWSDADQATVQQLKHLQQHNDVASVMITDPMENQLIASTRKAAWVLGDGEYQISINDDKQLSLANQELQTQMRNQRTWLTQLMALKKLPYLELETSGSHLDQFIAAIGGRY